MTLTRLVAAVALLLALSGLLADPALVQQRIAHAEREPGILGTVTDYVSQRPVPGALIGVQGQTLSARTDAQGKYALRLPPGEYEVVVTAEGYITMSRVQQRVDSGGPTVVDFELIPSAPTSEQQAEIERRFRREQQELGPGGAGGAATELQWLARPAIQLKESDDILDSPVVAGVPPTITILLSANPPVTKTMDFEEYLKGVVPAEVPPSWPAESLKAQAVAARSYAATSNRYPQYGAQVGVTTETQVWSDKRYVTTDNAVESTRGVVATAAGKIARTLFFAQCREGRTYDSENVFQGAPVEYLRGVTCPHQAPDQRGHGVGMCQFGAKTMAEGALGAPASYADIIAHYYRGIRLANVAQPPPAPRPRYAVAGQVFPAAADLFLSWGPDGGEYNAVVVDNRGALITELPWTETWTWRVGRLPPGRYTWRVRARFGDETIGDWSEPLSFQIADLPYRNALPLIIRQSAP